MEITDLILSYPKDYPLGLSEEEVLSFDVNNKQQVVALINEVLPELAKTPLYELAIEEQLRCGWIIEGVLEGNFGYNSKEVEHKEFVKEYVLANYERAKRNHELIAEGLKSLRKR